MNDFIVTKEYKRFSEFCKACQREKYIGLCYGPAGIGKSMSAFHFANWTCISEQIKTAYLYGIYNTEPSIDMASFNTVVYLPGIINSPRAIKDDIYKLMNTFNFLKEKSLYGNNIPVEARLKSYVELLIIDEADRLQPKSLEQIRDIYDRQHTIYEGQQQLAVILIGMPGLEKRLVRFPQLYSRIGFAHAFKSLTEEEVRFIMQNHCQQLGVTISANDFTDHEAIATIIRITQGNFRLINRLLKQVMRVMSVNQLSSISKEVVEAARECLIIGNVY